MQKIRCDSQKDVEFRKRHQKRKWQSDLARRTPRKKKSLKRWRTHAEKPTSIRLPLSFDVFDNSTDSIEVINKLRAYVDEFADQHKTKRCTLDFRELEKLQAASALVLMAEIDMWHIKSKKKLIAHTHNWSADIHKFMKELGFFDLVEPLETKKLKEAFDQQKITYLQVVRGERSDGKVAKELREKAESTFNVGLGTKKINRLYAALTESFMNAHQHAYEDEPAYWWLVAAYNKQERLLTVAVYDRGLGIPNTIRKKLGENIQKLFPIVNIDSKLISEAVESSFYDEDNTRTRMKKTYHGRGLKQIAELAAEGGELKIASLRGYCSFGVDKDKLTPKYQGDLGAKLQGTLIEWTIRI